LARTDTANPKRRTTRPDVSSLSESAAFALARPGRPIWVGCTRWQAALRRLFESQVCIPDQPLGHPGAVLQRIAVVRSGVERP